jgi:hypothetical protein
MSEECEKEEFQSELCHFVKSGMCVVFVEIE